MLCNISVTILVAGWVVGLVYCNGMKKGDDEDTLVLVHVLFRHGDRSPDKSEVYPKDPNAQLGFGPIGYGQLTKEGKRREYLIGKSLRQKYDKFLGLYGPDSLVAKSTDYVRTRMSCLLVLAGLYPPSASQIWENSILWQPIPYEYESYEKDIILGDPLKHCAPYKRLYEEFLLSPMGSKFYLNNKIIYDYLSINTGWDIKTPKHIYDLYFLLKSRDTMGLKLPAWAEGIWPTNVTILGTDEYTALTASPRMMRVAIGYLLEKILADTDLKITNELPKDRKLYLYSAHEYNIAFMLKALGLFEPHIPPFGSYITFEVHKVQGVYGFKVLYQDYEGSPTEPKLLKLPNCDVFCPIDKFRHIVDVHLPQPQDCTN